MCFLVSKLIPVSRLSFFLAVLLVWGVFFGFLGFFGLFFFRQVGWGQGWCVFLADCLEPSSNQQLCLSYAGGRKSILVLGMDMWCLESAPCLFDTFNYALDGKFLVCCCDHVFCFA